MENGWQPEMTGWSIFRFRGPQSCYYRSILSPYVNSRWYILTLLAFVPYLVPLPLTVSSSPDPRV
jgi:hypothetical protein